MTTQFQIQMDAPAILQHEARKKFEKEQQMKQQQENGDQDYQDNNQQQQQKWKPKEKQSDNNNKKMDKDNNNQQMDKDNNNQQMDKDNKQQMDKDNKQMDKDNKQMDKDKQLGKDNKQLDKDNQIDKVKMESDKDKQLDQAQKNLGDKSGGNNKDKQQTQQKTVTDIYEKDIKLSDKEKLPGKNPKQQQQPPQQNQQFVQIPNQGQKKNQAEMQTQTQAQGTSLLGEEQKDQTQDQKKARAAATNTESKTNEDVAGTTNITDDQQQDQQQQQQQQQQTDESKVESLDFSNLLNIIMSLFFLFKQNLLWKPLGFVGRTFIGKRMFPEGLYYDKYFKPIVQFFKFRLSWKLFFVDRILQGMKDFGSNMMENYLFPPIKDHMKKLRQVDGMFALFRYIFDVTLDLIVFACMFPLIVMAGMLFTGVWMYRQYLRYKKNIFRMIF